MSSEDHGHCPIPLPTDIVRRISQFLRPGDDTATLAALTLASPEYHGFVNLTLYKSFVLNERSWAWFSDVIRALVMEKRADLLPAAATGRGKPPKGKSGNKRNIKASAKVPSKAPPNKPTSPRDAVLKRYIHHLSRVETLRIDTLPEGIPADAMRKSIRILSELLVESQDLVADPFHGARPEPTLDSLKRLLPHFSTFIIGPRALIYRCPECTKPEFEHHDQTVCSDATSGFLAGAFAVTYGGQLKHLRVHQPWPGKTPALKSARDGMRPSKAKMLAQLIGHLPELEDVFVDNIHVQPLPVPMEPETNCTFEFISVGVQYDANDPYRAIPSTPNRELQIKAFLQNSRGYHRCLEGYHHFRNVDKAVDWEGKPVQVTGQPLEGRIRGWLAGVLAGFEGIGNVQEQVKFS